MTHLLGIRVAVIWIYIFSIHELKYKHNSIFREQAFNAVGYGILQDLGRTSDHKNEKKKKNKEFLHKKGMLQISTICRNYKKKSQGLIIRDFLHSLKNDTVLLLWMWTYWPSFVATELYLIVWFSNFVRAMIRDRTHERKREKRKTKC